MIVILKALFDLAKLFPLLSNVSNPVIYSFTSERFRDECVKLLSLKPCRRLVRRGSVVSTSIEMSQSDGPEPQSYHRSASLKSRS